MATDKQTSDGIFDNNIFSISIKSDKEIKEIFGEDDIDNFQASNKKDLENNAQADNKNLSNIEELPNESRTTEAVINKNPMNENLLKQPPSDASNDNINSSGNISDSQDKNTSRRTLTNRMFGPIDPGSIRGSIFNLAILSLGSACLAMPQKMGQMSVVVTIIDIFISGIVAYWTLNILILSSEKMRIYNYSKLVEKLYGKGMAMFLDSAMLLFIFGIMILYQVIGKSK